MSNNGEDNPFNAAMLGGAQTSTSKALLIFIHVPKVLRVHIAKDETKRDRKDSVDNRDVTTTSETKPPDHKKTSSMASNKPSHRKNSSVTSGKPSGKPPAKPSGKTSGKPSGHRKTGSFASLRNEVPMVPLDTVSTGGSTIPSTNNTPKGSVEQLLLDPADSTRSKEDDDALLPSGEHQIGYVESKDVGHDKKKTIEHVITAQEMAAIVNLDELGIDEAKKEGQVWDAPPAEEEKADSIKKKEEASTTEEPQTLSKAVKSFFGIVTDKEDEVTSRLNREEAIRIVKAQASVRDLPEERENNRPAPNTEIKVEALLQLTCKNLYKEGCFFTAPAQINITKGDEKVEWIQFTIMCKQASIDLVLERLERIGVGSSVGMISIYKSELLKTADWPRLDEGSDGENKNDEKKTSDEKGANKQGGDSGELVEEAKQEWKNAASRMRVEQIKEQIHEQAALSFDFVALLLIASILAGVGLIVNSTVVIVASMLVSPIMGPVMGITFGSRVLDFKLAKDSAFNELAALLIAVMVGAVVGFASAFSEFADAWPTQEMESRGDVGGLIVGIAIAVPSGMGVALSILGNNTSSLVGVAISASLLPPAVNAGICWAHAILIQAGHVRNDADFVTIGAISFALTMINILCIWIFGIVMFAIKEVAPSEKKSAFWARDIKVARATQKHGPTKKEVDIEKIKAGLQEALEKKRIEEGNLEGAKATAKARYMKRFRRRHKPADFSFSLIDDAVEEDDEDYLEFFMLGLNPLMEDTQGLDANDRAAYLGFRASVQDFATEEEPVPEKPAWLSWFGR